MPRLRAGETELAVQIIGSHLDVAHSHPWICVTEQFHDRRQGYARADHLTCVGVSKLVRDDAGGDTGRGTDFVQVEAQLTNQGGLPVGTS